MTEIRKPNESAIKSRLVRAQKSGELPKKINVDDCTRYLSTIIVGLSIQAANGATKDRAPAYRADGASSSELLRADFMNHRW
jgi:hypothetical protein